MENKTFNQLTNKDPICIKVTTNRPIISRYEKECLKKFFQETICLNKIKIIDCAFATTSYLVESNDYNTIYEKQDIYICFDKWISREEGSTQNISFTSYMNEMSEHFAVSYPIRFAEFIPDNVSCSLDYSDWVVSYHDSISSIRELTTIHSHIAVPLDGNVTH